MELIYFFKASLSLRDIFVSCGASDCRTMYTPPGVKNRSGVKALDVFQKAFVSLNVVYICILARSQ